jgi:hypothetical protein
MLPLRALSEMLGYTVHWDGALAEVRLGNAISFRIGQNSYLVGRMAPITLDAAPEIKNNLTFVPIDFYEKVLHIKVQTTATSFVFIQEAE